MMQLEILPKLSSDFLKLFKDSYNYDVIIQVKEKEFKAHSIILYARSNYFKILLSEGRIFNEDNTIYLKMTEIDPKVFEMIIMYVFFFRSFFLFFNKNKNKKSFFFFFFFKK